MSKNSTILIDAIQSDCSSETIKKNNSRWY